MLYPMDRNKREHAAYRQRVAAALATAWPPSWFDVSKDFDKSNWVKTKVTVSAADTSGWHKVADSDTTTALHYTSYDVPNTSALEPKSLVIDAKAGEFNRCALSISDNATGGPSLIANFTNGTVTDGLVGDGSWTNIIRAITPISDGYRLTLVGTKTGGATCLPMVMTANNSGQISHAGVIGSGFYARNWSLINGDVTAPIWTEGDSYMADVAGGSVLLSSKIATNSAKRVINTGVTGSNPSAILTRVSAQRSDLFRDKTFVMWDGVIDFTQTATASVYLALIAQIASKLDLSKSLFLTPVALPVGFNGSQVTMTNDIRTAMIANYPCIDSLSVLNAVSGTAANTIDASLLSGDNIHLIDSAKNAVATAIQANLSGRGLA